jgi:hypothetical protein
LYIIKVGYKWIGKPNKKGNFCLVSKIDDAYKFKKIDKAQSYAGLVNGVVVPEI